MRAARSGAQQVLLYRPMQRSGTGDKLRVLVQLVNHIIVMRNAGYIIPFAFHLYGCPLHHIQALEGVAVAQLRTYSLSALKDKVLGS